MRLAFPLRLRGLVFSLLIGLSWRGDCLGIWGVLRLSFPAFAVAQCGGVCYRVPMYFTVWFLNWGIQSLQSSEGENYEERR